MKNVEILFKKLRDDAQLPTQAHIGDAGFDLYSCDEVIIFPGNRKIIDCGFSMAIPQGWEAQIRPRSGHAAKNGITVLNTPGTIDNSYRGSVMVILYNTDEKPFTVKKGNRIAQMVISEIPLVSFKEVKDLPETERGVDGIGSSGV